MVFATDGLESLSDLEVRPLGSAGSPLQFCELQRGNVSDAAADAARVLEEALTPRRGRGLVCGGARPRGPGIQAVVPPSRGRGENPG